MSQTPSATAPRVAITGAHGWVGRRVAAYFAAHGWQVLKLVRHPAPEEVAAGTAAAWTLEAGAARGTLQGVQALVHCAYDFQPLTWPELQRVNVTGTRALFAAAREAGVPRLAYISTMSAYVGARSLYGRAKLAAEAIAAEYGALIVRPGLVYGEAAGGMYGSLEKQVAGASLLPLIGGGTQVLYLVHEADLGELLHTFATSSQPAPEAPVTAAHPTPWTFRAILEELARRQGKPLKFLPVPWRAVWLALKTAETLGLRLGFRSDSLISLMYQDPAPSFAVPTQLAWRPRPFAGS